MKLLGYNSSLQSGWATCTCPRGGDDHLEGQLHCEEECAAIGV
jgi:hypothetical protein